MRWLIPSLQNKLITLQVSPSYICCSLIEPSKNSKSHQFELKAYQRIALSSFQFQESMLCNPTYLKQFMASFMKVNSLSCVFGAIAITGPGVDQHYITRPNAGPARQDFSSHLKSATHSWDYTYLYPAQAEQGFVFYRCSIPREVLMQYHLFAISQRMELLAITTPQSVLFNLYKHMHSQSFSSSRLAQDMLKHDNSIEKLFSTESLKKLLHIPVSLRLTIEEELPYLSTALGLIISTNFYNSDT